MNLAEITKEVRKVAPSATEEQVKSFLEESKIEERLVDQKMITLISQRLQSGLEKTKQAIAPAQKNSQLTIAPAVSRKTKAATSFEAAKDRKVDAATDVATGGDRFVADVLEEAERKANEKLQAQKQALVSELSDAMVEHRLSQARTSVDFFMNQWGSTEALLNPYRQAMADEQTETIEVPAS